MNSTDELISIASKNIDNASEYQVKEDMKQLVLTLVNFVGSERPEIFDKNIPRDEKGKLFLKLIGGVVADSVTAQFGGAFRRKFDEKIEGIMNLEPLLIKYCNE